MSAVDSNHPSAPRFSNRRIAAIAVPALGSLVAEPLYLLVDAVIVGHLGRQELAALAIASQIIGTIASLCVFLAYGTTTMVARATDDRRRAELGAQALWLGALTGAVAATVMLLFAGPIARLIGGDTETAQLAARYVRLSALGVAAQLMLIAGQGWLRGREQLRLALRLVVAGQLINLVAELVLVYGFGLGLDGSALGTVLAQLLIAGVTVWLVVRAARSAGGTSLRPDRATQRALSHFGGLLFMRSVALSGAFLALTTAAAHLSDSAVGAHLIGIQLLFLGALALDALAIAAQVLVAGALGAGDHAEARRTALRLTAISTGFGVLVGALLWALGPDLVVGVFRDDDAIKAAARDLWPWLCLIQVIGGVVFALDGILIATQDGRFLALAMIGAAAVLGLFLLIAGTDTITALWSGLTVMFVARTLPLAARTLRGPLQAG